MNSIVLDKLNFLGRLKSLYRFLASIFDSISLELDMVRFNEVEFYVKQYKVFNIDLFIDKPLDTRELKKISQMIYNIKLTTPKFSKIYLNQ